MQKADINDALILNEEAKRQAFHDAGYDKLLFIRIDGYGEFDEEQVRRNEARTETYSGDRFRVKTPQALVAILDSCGPIPHRDRCGKVHHLLSAWTCGTETDGVTRCLVQQCQAWLDR